MDEFQQKLNNRDEEIFLIKKQQQTFDRNFSDTIKVITDASQNEFDLQKESIIVMDTRLVQHEQNIAQLTE